MSKILSELLYSKSHEWVKMTSDSTAKVGITDYAQNSLGDIVFVDLHPVKDSVEVEGSLADIESVKAVSEIFSPLAGTICAVNDDLVDSPELLNEDCYANWICELENISGQEDLMDASQYEAFLTTQD